MYIYFSNRISNSESGGCKGERERRIYKIMFRFFFCLNIEAVGISK